MTNVYATPEKVSTKARLFQIGVETLEGRGWTVERIPKMGKASVRRITKGKESRIVSIRTTQDTWIAFPRNSKDDAWVTLAEVDTVVAVSVDDRLNPRFAQVHIIDGDDMRDRFDRAYAARLKAGHSIPVGRGLWLALYTPDEIDPPAHVGGGAGLVNPPIARVPLDNDVVEQVVHSATRHVDVNVEDQLTIAEAKRRLAMTFGVDPSSVQITIAA